MSVRVRNTMHECIYAYSRVCRAATVTCFALCQAPPGCTGREALRRKTEGGSIVLGSSRVALGQAEVNLL